MTSRLHERASPCHEAGDSIGSGKVGLGKRELFPAGWTEPSLGLTAGGRPFYWQKGDIA